MAFLFASSHTWPNAGRCLQKELRVPRGGLPWLLGIYPMAPGPYPTIFTETEIGSCELVDGKTWMVYITQTRPMSVIYADQLTPAPQWGGVTPVPSRYGRPGWVLKTTAEPQTGRVIGGDPKRSGQTVGTWRTELGHGRPGATWKTESDVSMVAREVSWKKSSSLQRPPYKENQGLSCDSCESRIMESVELTVRPLENHRTLTCQTGGTGGELHANHTQPWFIQGVYVSFARAYPWIHQLSNDPKPKDHAWPLHVPYENRIEGPINLQS